MTRQPRAMLRFREIISRITGISGPFFGVSWNPPKAEREVVRDLLIFLEDRRVITYEETWGPMAAGESVLDIRSKLTDVLQELPEGSKAAPPVRRMRSAYREYLDAMPEGQLPSKPKRTDRFFRALETLPRTIGRQAAVLAGRYGIDLEPQLADLAARHGRLKSGGWHP